jgi:uncharacterized protein with PIN domain
MNPSEIHFAADRMLGRLARMLRLLGYDTVYSADITPAQLSEIAHRADLVLLTRGAAGKRFPSAPKVLVIKSDRAPEQLREVVSRFALDTRQGLWSRCTLCNGRIERAAKSEVEALVPSKVLEVYREFYRCSACHHIYWQGSHVTRILENLEALLGDLPG